MLYCWSFNNWSNDMRLKKLIGAMAAIGCASVLNVYAATTFSATSIIDNTTTTDTQLLNLNGQIQVWYSHTYQKLYFKNLTNDRMTVDYCMQGVSYYLGEWPVNSNYICFPDQYGENGVNLYEQGMLFPSYEAKDNYSTLYQNNRITVPDISIYNPKTGNEYSCSYDNLKLTNAGDNSRDLQRILLTCDYIAIAPKHTNMS